MVFDVGSFSIISSADSLQSFLTSSGSVTSESQFTSGNSPHVQFDISSAYTYVSSKDGFVTSGDTFPIVCDSGASFSVSFAESDFVGPINRSPSCTSLKYAAGPIRVTGEGYVKWFVMEDDGRVRSLVTKAFLVPRCNVRLLSTSTTMSAYPDEHFTIDKEQLVLSGINGDTSRSEVTAQSCQF